MTNWLENLCSQMDPADQPFGPTALVFLKQSRGLEMHRDKVHPNPLLTLGAANAHNYEGLHALSLMYFMIGVSIIIFKQLR